MLLHTPLYLLFLALVAGIYWLLPAFRARKVFLLLASYVFYALLDWRFLALLLALSAGAYILGIQIGKGAHARRYAWWSVALNLGILGLFKYYDFFADSINHALSALGASLSLPVLHLLLPIGISFYTFQAISYTTEVYRRSLPPAPALDLALYLAFFPKLIAGPLVRPAAFFKQLAGPAPAFPRQRLGSLLALLLLGLAKKLIIADSLAAPAGVAFQAASLPAPINTFPTPLYLQGFYLYAFQIYADFSGYTDIALASAGLLGFLLPENFRQPYLAVTLADFWNRWHMSLTQWFREYLFFPLSRGLLQATHRRWPELVQTGANLLTMLLIGFWHGAAWTYLAWGLWHGLLLSAERLLRWKPSGALSRLLSGVVTFHLVGLGWVLFNSSGFAAALRFYAGLFSFEQMDWLPYYLPSILVTAGVVFGIDLAAVRRPNWNAAGWRWAYQILVVATLFVLVMLQVLSLARGGEPRPFIYGQF